MIENVPSHQSIPTLSTHHRRNVVVEALLEKLEKVEISRSTLEHECARVRMIEKSIVEKIDQLADEAEQLRCALNEHKVSAGPVTSDHSLSLADARRGYSIAASPAQGPGLANARRRLNPESHQRRTVVEMAMKILEVAGSLPTNSLYEILMGQGIDVPSKNRLSQILSEAPEFEADRINGWSLKSEKPGVR